MAVHMSINGEEFNAVEEYYYGQKISSSYLDGDLLYEYKQKRPSGLYYIKDDETLEKKDWGTVFICSINRTTDFVVADISDTDIRPDAMSEEDVIEQVWVSRLEPTVREIIESVREVGQRVQVTLYILATGYMGDAISIHSSSYFNVGEEIILSYADVVFDRRQCVSLYNNYRTRTELIVLGLQNEPDATKDDILKIPYDDVDTSRVGEYVFVQGDE